MLNRVTEQLVGDGLGLATQTELDTHNTAKTGVHGVGTSYVAKTSRSDQLPAWADVPDKPASYTPTAHKSTHATGGSDAIAPADIGAETPSAAQTKANTAETNAKGYADTVAATAESNAKGYADTVAATAQSNAESHADTSAATAESNAKTYAESLITSRFVAVPASATATGEPGDWSADDAYLYVCHAANTWKRVAIATW